MAERDDELELHLPEWPKEAPRPPRWTQPRRAGMLQRNVIGGDDPETALATPLKERVLRFPSAPSHGLHRLSQEHVNMGPVESERTAARGTEAAAPSSEQGAEYVDGGIERGSL